MKTSQLIAELARDLPPRPPLAPPWRRAGAWLLAAVVYFGILVLLMTSRADVAANGLGWRFVAPQIAAMLTAAASAVAAAAATVPGYSRRILLLPAAAATAWFLGIAYLAAPEWTAAGGAGLAAPREWRCVAMMVLGGMLPAWALTIRLRQGAPMRPRVTAALGVLATAALASIGACITEPHPSQLVTLTWHGTTILLLVAAAAWLGPGVFRWRPDRLDARRTT